MARILMIDDDSDIVEAVRIPLEAAGHEFHRALERRQRPRAAPGRSSPTSSSST